MQKRSKPWLSASVVDMESQIELFNSIVVNGSEEHTPVSEANCTILTEDPDYS